MALKIDRIDTQTFLGRDPGGVSIIAGDLIAALKEAGAAVREIVARHDKDCQCHPCKVYTKGVEEGYIVPWIGNER